MDPMWKILQIKIDIEDPTPFIDQVYLSCTQREAKVDPRAVHSKNELFNKLTTTREADEKDQTKGKYSLEKITAWSYDMEGHAEESVERYCELAKKDVSSLQQVATACIDDHQIPPEDYATTGALSAVCAQID